MFKKKDVGADGEENSLSHVALGGGVEGRELHYVGVLGSHLKQNLLEGVKLAALCVYVILVHLHAEHNISTEGPAYFIHKRS